MSLFFRQSIALNVDFYFTIFVHSSLFHPFGNKKLKIGRCFEKHVLHINTEISIEIARRETKHGLEQTLHCVQQTH